VIHGHVTQIEADEAMVRMAHNIVEGLLCHDFTAFLSNEIINNIFNINKGDFRNYSYLGSHPNSSCNWAITFRAEENSYLLVYHSLYFLKPSKVIHSLSKILNSHSREASSSCLV